MKFLATNKILEYYDSPDFSKVSKEELKDLAASAGQPFGKLTLYKRTYGETTDINSQLIDLIRKHLPSFIVDLLEVQDTDSGMVTMWFSHVDKMDFLTLKTTYQINIEQTKQGRFHLMSTVDARLVGQPHSEEFRRFLHSCDTYENNIMSKEGVEIALQIAAKRLQLFVNYIEENYGFTPFADDYSGE